jgi:hypothetical protein
MKKYTGAVSVFERDRREYMGYTIGQSIFSSSWVVRQGRRYVGSAPSAFDAVELVDGIIDDAVKEQVLQGNLNALAGLSERPGRNEAINGKNPSIQTIADREGAVGIGTRPARLRRSAAKRPFMTVSSKHNCPHSYIESALDRWVESHWHIHQMEVNYHTPDLFRYCVNSFIRSIREVPQLLSMELQNHIDYKSSLSRSYIKQR